MSSIVLGVDLSKITPTKPKSSNRKSYPEVPDESGELAEAVDSLIPATVQAKALEGQIKTLKHTLVTNGKEYYFLHCNGRSEIPSSMEVHGTQGKSVLVSMTNRYPVIPVNEENADLIKDIEAVVGGAEGLKKSFSIKIDGDRIPADKAQHIIDMMMMIFKAEGCLDALSATTMVKPIPEFHTIRHGKLTAAENMTLDKLFPFTAAVKKR